MKGSILLFIMLWIFWMFLSGFDVQEVVAGALVSSVISVIIGYGFLRGPKTRYWKGLGYFLAYIPYYLCQEAVSVSDVFYRIITGRINPGIVKVGHEHKHNWGVTVLSNSITMTPGTLTLEAGDKNLYVHWLNMKGDKNMITGKFERFLKNIWD